MGTLIDAGETPSGNERICMGYGWKPSSRWEILITYPSGLQQPFNCGSDSAGVITFTYPLYEEGDVRFQIAEPAPPRQVEDGPEAPIQAHEVPQNKRAPAHVKKGAMTCCHLADGEALPAELDEKVHAVRLEKAMAGAARVAAAHNAAADARSRLVMASQIVEATKQIADGEARLAALRASIAAVAELPSEKEVP